MPGSIIFKLKDTDETVSLTLNVPAEYTSSQLLTEVIEACQLDCLDAKGEPIRYGLQPEASGQILAPHLTLGQSKILRGETVYLVSVSVAAQAGYYPKPTNPENLAPYRREALKYLAAGDYEKALGVFLERWREFNQVRQTASATVLRSMEAGRGLNLNLSAELETIKAEIEFLIIELIEEQYKNTSFQHIYDILQLEAAKEYFDFYPDSRQHYTSILVEGSYKLAKLQRYTDARDFAVLALQLNPANEDAQILESLSQQYLNMLSTEDAQERLELAQSIYEIDPDFGNIEVDRLGLPLAGRNREQAAEKTKTVTIPTAPTQPGVTVPLFREPTYTKPRRLLSLISNLTLVFFTLMLFVFLVLWIFSN